MGVSQLVTAQGHIFGIQRGWVGDTNLIPTDLKHLLAEWPSQIVNRDNPAQGHKSHLCHLSPCGQGTLLCQAGVPIPGKWGSTESLSQSLGSFPLPCFHSQEPAPDPIQLLQLQAPARSCQKKAPNPGAEERQRIWKRPWQSSQRLHGATVWPKSPPQNSQFLHKSGQKELPQPRGEAHSSFYWWEPGWAAVAYGNSAGTRNGGRQRVPEGKAFVGGSRERLPALPKSREQRKHQHCATKPSVSQGREVVSLLSHEEFTTMDSLGLDSGRDGVGGLRGVWQHGASRRGRGNAFLVSFLQILWEERKENGGVRGKGWSCQSIGRCQVFSNHWASHTSASACG